MISSFYILLKANVVKEKYINIFSLFISLRIGKYIDVEYMAK